MDQKQVSCDQMMQRIGYYCMPTVDTYGVCLLKAATAERSLMVCVQKAIRLNTNKDEILPMRFQKDEEMTVGMNVGLTPEAEFIWVTPCSDLKQIGEDAEKKLAIELTLERLEEVDFGFDFAAMATVKEVEPYEAECVLVRAPKQDETKMTKLDQWRLGVLKREALYYQETEDKFYVIVPAGFINVIHVAADKKQEFDVKAFYEENAKPYREKYQNLLYDKPLDEVKKYRDEERALPERRTEAKEILREIEELKANELEVFSEVWKPQADPDIAWAKDETAVILRGDEFAMTKDGVDGLRKKLDELKQQMMVVRDQKAAERAAEKVKQDAENARLARIQAFREVITICEYNVTVEDYAGKLVRNRPVKVPFLKIKEVRVVFTEDEARIEVWRSGKQLEAETTRYDYNDTVTAFQARLKELLKAWPYCYREDGLDADFGLDFD